MPMRLFRTWLGVTLALAAPSAAQTVCTPQLEKRLLAPDAQQWDNLGSRVAIDGDTAVGHALGPGTWGSAYVFVRSLGQWTFQAKLLSPEPLVHGIYFGRPAISGPTIVCGLQNGWDNAAPGAAYAFERGGVNWSHSATLMAADGHPGDGFGNWTAMEGDTAVVGARYADTAGLEQSGAAYVFTRTGGAWPQTAKLTAPVPQAYSWFGYSVAISGQTLLIGERERSRAYVFVRSGGVWMLQGTLTPNPPVQGFGESADLDGDTAIVGSTSYGGAFIFKRSGGAWTQEARLTQPPPTFPNSAGFGFAVAIEGDVAAVGNPDFRTASGKTGAAYLYTRSGTTWTERAGIIGFDPAPPNAFGRSLALDGGTLIVGDLECEPLGIPGSGAAYAYATNCIAACYPDCDGSSALSVNDYICFQTRFALGDPYADCDGSGVRNVNDYICFQTRFALGCS